MKMSANATTIAVGAVVVVGLYFFLRDQIGAGLSAVGGAVNPLSDKNIAYTGTNSVGAAITGDAKFDIGSSIYNLFHPNEGKDLATPTPLNKGTTASK